jgi:hypothetical protein
MGAKAAGLIGGRGYARIGEATTKQQGGSRTRSVLPFASLLAPTVNCGCGEHHQWGQRGTQHDAQVVNMVSVYLGAERKA